MEILQQGGFFLGAIILLGFVVVVISVEKAMTLYLRFRLDGQKFFEELKKFAYLQEWGRVQELCETHSRNPLARILEAGIIRRKASLEEIQLGMEAEASYQIPRITRRLHALSALANVSTLIGLVGTVVGLIKSFSALGGTAANTLDKGQALASGVSEAMFATAGGLMVAIPAILAHLVLQGKAQAMLEDIDHFALELKKIMVNLQRSTKPSPEKHQERSSPHAFDSITEKKVAEKEIDEAVSENTERHSMKAQTDPFEVKTEIQKELPTDDEMTRRVDITQKA